MPTPTIGCSRALAALIVACCIPLVGCMRWHTTNYINIEVIDGLTGEPAPSTEVWQVVPTHKFEPPLYSITKTDEQGVVHMRAVGGVGSSNWHIGKGGPSYRGGGSSIVPAEFRLAASRGDDGREQFIAPLWPAMRLRIELPAAYRGCLVEWPLAEDSPRSSGWMAPATVAADSERVAIARINGDGAIAYPNSFAGVRGFAFVPERGFIRGTVLSDGLAPRRIDASTQLSAQRRAEMDPSQVWVWDIGYCGDGRWVSAQGRSATATTPFVWFIGTEPELCAWVAANKLQLVSPGINEDLDALGRSRWFTRESVMAVVRRPTSATEPPVWTTNVQITASRAAVASAGVPR